MKIGKLTRKDVKDALPNTRLGDGGGLWLVTGANGQKRFVFRFTIDGRVTEMGLGSLSDTSLEEAREAALAARKLVKEGVSPIEARRAKLLAARGVNANKVTFGDCVTQFIAEKGGEWRSEKHRKQWHTTLTTHAAALCPMPVDEITTDHVFEVLQPLFDRARETGARLRGRIETILDYAVARRFRPENEANPARWRGALALRLPKRRGTDTQHLVAMDYNDVPAFMAKLRRRPGLSARALEFCVLSGLRTNEVLGTRWSEIDMKTKVLTVPATRMKAGREHRCPLSTGALEILRQLKKTATTEFVFPGASKKKPLCDRALRTELRRMGVEGAQVHGFRSSLRDFAGNETHFPHEVCEAALAHTILNKTEAAYRRSDALEKRRNLMQMWCDHCGTAE
jgi:integrase